MTKKMQKSGLGIFGGTFDPVHYGHIKPALNVKQALNLQQLLFVPNKIPPHRAPPWLSVQQRLQLLEIALKNQRGVSIDKRELSRAGVSYMVDTLLSIKQESPHQTLYLIIGLDVFYTINTWYNWRELFNLCHLVVTTRPSYHFEDVEKNIKTQDYRFLKNKIEKDIYRFKAQKQGKILLQPVLPLAISSSQIRKQWRERNKVDNKLNQQLPVEVRLALEKMKPA